MGHRLVIACRLVVLDGKLGAQVPRLGLLVVVGHARWIVKQSLVVSYLVIDGLRVGSPIYALIIKHSPLFQIPLVFFSVKHISQCVIIHYQSLHLCFLNYIHESTGLTLGRVLIYLSDCFIHAIVQLLHLFLGHSDSLGAQRVVILFRYVFLEQLFKFLLRFISLLQHLHIIVVVIDGFILAINLLKIP